MKLCQGIIPAQRVPQSQMVEQLDEHGATVWVRDSWEEIIPEAPCDQPATMLARSMKQVKCELFDRLRGSHDGIHWLPVGDAVYCSTHFVPGTMTHLDGRVTPHAEMSVDDA